MSRPYRKQSQEVWDTRIDLAGKCRTVREWVDRKAWDPAWREVICLLVGRLEDAGPLLEMLSNPSPTATNPSGDDAFRHRLALGAACLPELRESARREQAAWIDAITAEVFGLWWQAPAQTLSAVYRELDRALPALGQVNGRVPAEGRPEGWTSVRDRQPSNVVSLLDRVTKLLHDEDFRMRKRAAVAVGLLGSAAASDAILDWLAQLLRDTRRNVRQAAAIAVSHLGPAAATKAIAESLGGLLHDTDRRMHESAAGTGAAGSVGSDKCRPRVPPR